MKKPKQLSSLATVLAKFEKVIIPASQTANIKGGDGELPLVPFVTEDDIDL